MEKHGEIISDFNLTSRFVSDVQKQEGSQYSDVMTFYRGQMILGNPCNISNLREFLAYTHVNKAKVAVSPAMKSLASATKCNYCGKIGHNEKECWKKHPKNIKTERKGKYSPPKPRECWKFGEVGHLRRDCLKKNGNRPRISTAVTKRLINENDAT